MKKLLICLSIAMMPVVAFADFDDVTLTTTAVISINDSAGNAVSLNVSGSSAVVESIVVGVSSFSVTLQSGSSITVASAGRNLITTNAPDINESISCGDSESSITLTATAGVTASVSVSPNACGAAASSSSSVTGSNGPVAQSGGGGGGGGGSMVVTPTVTTSPNTTVEALQAMIASLSTQIADLIAAKGGSPLSTSFSFSLKLAVGSRSSEVLIVQKVLNADADTQIAVSGVGSLGNETTFFGPATKKAIQKFQVKYGLAGPGKQGYGVFGPKTKAKIIEIGKLKGIIK